jgi:hypothetical protein
MFIRIGSSPKYNFLFAMPFILHKSTLKFTAARKQQSTARRGDNGSPALSLSRFLPAKPACHAATGIGGGQQAAGFPGYGSSPALVGIAAGPAMESESAGGAGAIMTRRSDRACRRGAASSPVSAGLGMMRLAIKARRDQQSGLMAVIVSISCQACQTP